MRILAIVGLALTFLLTSDGILPQPGKFGPGIAKAQQIKRVRKKRRTLLQMLFGGNRNTRRIKRNTRRRKKRGRRRRVAGAAAVPKVEKLEDARVVLVVGDFFAGGLAKGLARTFQQVPGVRIVRKSKGSSGFVRLDYYNWITEVGLAIDEHNPSVVVAMIGTNDRQLLRLDGKKLQKRTEEWDIAYKLRIDNFAKAVRAKNIPLVWMGLPPVRFKNMNQDFLVFNEIYRNGTQRAGGRFVDVWDGFTDAEGNYVTSGPNVDGQIVRLRSKDGINVTRSGQDKLAFYAEKPIKKLVGAYSAGALAGLQPDFAISRTRLAPSYDPAKTGRTVVINLNDPALDGGSVLAGGPGENKPLELIEPITADDTSKNNKKPDTGFVIGRADDYSWPRKILDEPLGPKRNATAKAGRI